MVSLEHFGVNIRQKEGGLKLTKENYAIASNKSSFDSAVLYSDEVVDKRLRNALVNYEINLQFYSKLDKSEFEDSIKILTNKNFVEVSDLNKYNKSGIYMMVLDEYKQVYIGQTNNIKKRIQRHWSRNFPLDRLVFGSVESSRIGIDSFRALDTTRIFVDTNSSLDEGEDKYINLIPNKFIANRMAGGKPINAIDALSKVLKFKK